MIKNVLYLLLMLFTFSINAQEKKINQNLSNKTNDFQKKMLIKEEVGDTINHSNSNDSPVKQLKPKQDFLLERNR